MDDRIPLRSRLTQAGIDVGDSLYPKVAEAPWFVRALQAFSGWLAALFLLGFIALGAVFVIESTTASLGLGMVMLGCAFALLRAARGELLEHLALAISLAGQMLVAWALIEVWEDSAYLWWALLVLQCVLALVMPSLVHRGFSAFAASVALYMALVTSAMGPVASGTVLLVLTALWLNEFRWPRRINEAQAWGVGLVLGLLFVQGLAHLGYPLPFFYDMVGGPWVKLGAWLGAGLVALALWWLLQTLRISQRLPSVSGLAYMEVVLLMAISLYVPSVGQGVVLVLIGFAIGHRMLTGLGVFSLILAIGSYYYWLEVTLLIKALTLLGLGGLLLVLRWGARQWLEPDVAHLSDGEPGP
ncbi:DUF4401 domain-containing protein [Vreelandella olivaria]|uniref:DUF4401 domain-containing protein n=1 Tax=Vreelandella olivaria TaxID=390919 RepID=UPI00201EFF63|nr:DUF4401 domain-containing protein [Halomonas olivaria]